MSHTPTILSAKRGWLTRDVKSFVENLPTDHPSINSCHSLQRLTVIDSKIAAFILQNDRAGIADWLDRPNDDSLNVAFHRYRKSKEWKAMIERQEGGNLDNYTQTLNIAKARKVYADFVRGYEERSNDNTLLFNGNEFTWPFYYPLRSLNNLYENALVEMARAKHTLPSSTSAEYCTLNNKIGNSKIEVLKVRVKRDQWFDSFQQKGDTTALTDILITDLLFDDVSDKDKDAFCAYMASVFEDDQMTHADRLVAHYKSKFWPQLQHQELEECERFFETHYRERILELRAAGRKFTWPMRKYKEQRRKTLLFIASRVLNPDHHAAKILLAQIKTRVDADEEESKKKSKKKSEMIKKQRMKRKLSESKSQFAGGDFTWDELEEAAFELLKQKTVKRVGNKL